MLKHERYCGKWKGERCCAGQHKCDGFQVTGARLLLAASRHTVPKGCLLSGGRHPSHVSWLLHPAQGEAGRAVICEPLPGCTKAKGTQRSSPQLGELAFGTALCPSPWRNRTQVNAGWGAGLILQDPNLCLAETWWCQSSAWLRGGCALCCSDLSWLGSAPRAHLCLPKCACLLARECLSSVLINQPWKRVRWIYSSI